MAMNTTAPQLDALPSARTLRKWVLLRQQTRRPRRGALSILAVWGVPAYVCSGIVWWTAQLPSGTAAANSSADQLFSVSIDPVVGQRYAWALVLILAAVSMQLFRALGPVSAEAGELAWILSGRVDRRAALTLRICGLTTIALAMGVGTARSVTFVFPTVSDWWVLGGYAAAGWSGLLSIAVFGQIFVTVRRLLVLLIGGLWAAGFGIAVAAASNTVPAEVFPMSLGSPTAVLSAGMAVVLFVAALRWSGQMDRAALGGSADVMTGISAACSVLDLSYLTGAFEARRWRRVATVTSRAFAGTGVGTLVAADLRRLRRHRGTWTVVGVASVCLYTVHAVGSPVLVAITQLVACFGVGMLCSGGLRDVCGSAALRFALGGSDIRLRLCHLAVPALAILGVWLASAPAAYTSGWAVLVIAPVGALAAVYRARRRPPTQLGGLVLETGLGQVPLDLLRQLLTGPAALAAAGALQVALLLLW
ncbi:DUF6297 family protein [Antrihabitans sp. NCIMB 15449]|jgi:hypothetical protein|uniref:DUF6297 family protein n=1 Tax=Antrihabitans spumae TaxID=3373370 RepID=A0ABW7JSV7_9NOCA